MQGNLFYIKLIRNLLSENDQKLNRVLAIVSKYFTNKNNKHIKRLQEEFLANQDLKRNEAEEAKKSNKSKATKSQTKTTKKKPITSKIADNDEDESEDEDYVQKDVEESSDSENEDMVEEVDESNSDDEYGGYNKTQSLSQQVVPKSKLSTFGSGIFAKKKTAKKSR